MRHTLLFLWFLSGILLLGACVPQRKLVLLQDKPSADARVNADELIKTIPLQQQPYVLKPGDVLSLKVQSITLAEFDFLNAGASNSGGADPILSGYTLDSEGNMLLPSVGNIQLAGLDLPQARAKVTEALKPYLTNPTVNLRLLTFRYTIMGEVGSQGQFTTYNDNINLIEAIALAGGLNPFANRSRIRLIRYDRGEAKLYTFSLLDDRTMSYANFYLQPNDMILVDALPSKYFKENWLANIGITVSLITTISFLLSRIL